MTVTFRTAITLLTALTLMFVGPAHARSVSNEVEQHTDVDHNGSNMLITILDGQFEIAYIEPKHALLKHGVRSNTILFSGTISNDGLVEGNAYVFRRGCTPEPYWVTGYFESQNPTFILAGEAPLRQLGDCDIIGHTASGSNAQLVFALYGGDQVGEGEEGGPAGEGYCGWWAIYSCHRARSAAERDQRRVGYGRIVRTRDIPNFKNGFYCLAEGPLSGRSEALNMADQDRGNFPTAYAKQGC